MSYNDITLQLTTEQRIAFELAKRYPGSAIVPNAPGLDSEKDFTLLRPFGVEVKVDYKSKETSNLFFEVYDSKRKQDSGLKATKSWRWVHYVPGTGGAHIYCPQTMLDWLKRQDDLKPIPGCGDGNAVGYVAHVAGRAQAHDHAGRHAAGD